MNMDIPVTLVIKAPNQKYNDQTISCFSDWTVEKLKAHLSHVYPSKPSSKDQRLVYSGRLLSDDLQLKDVFRKQDEYHMIHLVCASRTPPPSPQPRKRSSRNKTQAAATDTHTRPASAGTTTTTTTTSPVPPAGAPCDVPVQPTAAQSPLNTTAHPAFTQGYPWPQVPMATAGPASGPLLPISPMSLFWWQQAYAWHLYTHYQASLAAYYQTARPPQPDSQPEQPSEQQRQQQQQQQQQQRLAEAAGGEGPEEED
ncbi:homocysteine-responsive endoplasmic reticulum-resident ubiquitin-like domain member 2 protein, partial [Engraulis encrasicolus]|uniref:homocysteine-responsive endoplasmic reticulum-resident ubiquitin-like domain member 2 protein n=1 Tax=Engraulis encrasicolus TaxID=184585 RepID=UPI002FD72E7E